MSTCRCLNHTAMSCLTCGKAFGVCHSREKTAKYCSYKCGYRGTGNLKQIKTLVTKSCLFCGCKGEINADHIIPFAKIVRDNDMKKLWDVNNGRTLCAPCHRQTDTYGNRRIVI